MSALSEVQVVATTDVGTRCALAEATRFTKEHHSARIVLLVPRVISAFTESSPDDDNRIASTYRQIAASCGADVVVRVCVCRTVAEVVSSMVSKRGLAVVGGTRRWWWPTPAQRLANALKKHGHRVVFADVG